jgi:hypothetical protein
LAELAKKGVVGELAPFHVSVMGGVRRQKEIETELAPAIARELKKVEVDFVLLVPY